MLESALRTGGAVAERAVHGARPAAVDGAALTFVYGTAEPRRLPERGSFFFGVPITAMHPWESGNVRNYVPVVILLGLTP